MEKVYKCEWCDKKFTTQFNLKNHTLTSKKCTSGRGIKIENKFECEKCCRGFSQKHHLIRHLKSCDITIPKPYISKIFVPTETPIVFEVLNTFKIPEIQEVKEIPYMKNDDIKYAFQKLIETLYKISLENIKLQTEIKIFEEERLEEIEKSDNRILEIGIDNKTLLEFLDEKDEKISKLNIKIAECEGIIIGIKTMKPSIEQNLNAKYLKTKLKLLSRDNIKFLTVEYVQDYINKNYNIDVLRGRYAEFFIFFKKMMTTKSNTGVREQNYACSDKKRFNFKRLKGIKLNGEWDWESDNGGLFIHVIFDLMIQKTYNLMIEVDQKERAQEAVLEGSFKPIRRGIEKITTGIKLGSSDDRTRLHKKLRLDLRNFLIL
jgi:hypothetical protein